MSPPRRAARRTGGELLLLREVVGVELLHLVDLSGADAEVEVDHQLRQTLPVDEHYFGIDPLGVVDGRLREAAGSDEHAFPKVFSVQGSHELLDLGTADRALPFLGLQVDHVQTQAILLDDAVDALVPRKTRNPFQTGVSSRNPSGGEPGALGETTGRPVCSL